MTAQPEPNSQELNEKLASRIMDALQDAITAGEFGEASLVMASMTIVEVLDTDGHSRLSVIISDERLTTNLGLSNYGGLWIGSQIGGAT